MAEGKSQNQEKSSTFTMDADTTQTMPSVTKLLNRKKLGLSDSSKEERPASDFISPPPFQPEISPPVSVSIENTAQTQSEPKEISIRIETEESPPKAVEKRPRRSRRPVKALKLWDRSMLESDPHPRSKDLVALLNTGAHAFLLLTAHPPGPGESTPQFEAEAAFSDHPALHELWQGLRWKPNLTPMLWARFIKAGFSEAPPPGALTEPSSDRNLIRSAFACPASDTLTLVRVGSATECAGALVLLSKDSIVGAARTSLQNLTNDSKKAA